ncbi:hypothetical protein OCS_00614 [Ophiocordyceps sinensis CO18]|uniref:Uncharacterized protein n=1 Tax=Ophiocordyceps sinensis (strain Co18 / CGMCC 3.14243) TaxID=911162 RepID=T5APD1_OPHSC|nr:hypothetical protein OCS_00614 [Ophiocordyceps sinensis CO18]
MPSYDRSDLAGLAVHARYMSNERRQTQSAQRLGLWYQRNSLYRQVTEAAGPALHRPPDRHPELSPEKATSRPRVFERPKAPFLIDTKLPVLALDDPALADIRSVQVAPPQPRRARQASPQPTTSQHSLQPASATGSEPTSSSEDEFVVIDGVRTRKRRAQSNEIELIEGLHDAEDTSSSAAIPREAAVLPHNARRLV